MKIFIRFYEELNDFIPADNRKKQFSVQLNSKTNIKDLIESQGVPHTEIDLIIVNENPVNFDYYPADGDKIAVYPVFESLDISAINRLRPRPLRETKFILDVHLGKLARQLRMIGFDTLYQNDFEDNEIIRIAIIETRIILTRDKGILKNKQVTHGYYVHSTNPKTQIKEVIKRFDLSEQINPLSRCIDCNGTIVKIEKEKILHKLKPKTKTYFNDFFQCTGCHKIYWEGSHYEKMLKSVDSF